MLAELTSGETAFLVMVVTVFVAFAVTLFMCRLDYDRWLRREADRSHRFADALFQPAE